MLNEGEEDRLVGALPLEDVEIDVLNDDGEKETHNYDVTPYWHGSDHLEPDETPSPDYPAIVFDPDTQGEQKPEEQPADNVIDITNVEDEPEYITHEGSREFDELSVTIAVEATHDENGVAPDVRAKQIARHLWNWFRFEADDTLNEEGDNGERPVRTELITAPSPARVARTYRIEFAVRLHHTEEYERVQDTVGDAEYDVSTE